MELVRHAFGTLLRGQSNPGQGGDPLALPAGDYVGFAMGIESEYSQLRVNGQLVQACRILPLEVRGVPRIEPANGEAWGGAYYPNGGLPWQGHLIGFLRGATIINPGARVARHYEQRTLNAALAAAWNGADANELVVPFTGRTRVLVSMMTTSGTARLQFGVYGRRYLSRSMAAKVGAPYKYAPLEVTPQVVPAYDTLDQDTNGVVSFEWIEGGTDHEESYDEIVVMYGKHIADSAITCDAHVEVTVSGEQGAGGT